MIARQSAHHQLYSQNCFREGWALGRWQAKIWSNGGHGRYIYVCIHCRTIFLSSFIYNLYGFKPLCACWGQLLQTYWGNCAIELILIILAENPIRSLSDVWFVATLYYLLDCFNIFYIFCIFLSLIVTDPICIPEDIFKRRQEDFCLITQYGTWMLSRS